MKIFILIIVVVLLTPSVNNAQELFPNTEPASSIPKNVIGIRYIQHTFNEATQVRNLFALRVMYGLTSRLSMMATPNVSNHHGRSFPDNLATHVHEGNQTIFSTGDTKTNNDYIYKFNGVNFYTKYRFLSNDGKNQHFRMALYAQGTILNTAHTEAEPNLMDDNSGYGGGIITTYLKNKFAVSFTGGYIVPMDKNGFVNDPDGSGPVPTRIKYGRAFEYNLSFGYLIWPRVYKSYNQTNWNIYMEFLGKSYSAAQITQYGFVNVPIATPLLQSGNYIDIVPGIQTIIKSNLRIELSARLPFYRKSYAFFYPLYALGVQWYFF